MIDYLTWLEREAEESRREAERERRDRYEPPTTWEPVSVETATEIEPEDPVTALDRWGWMTEASDRETDRRLHLMTPEQRATYERRLQTAVAAKSFAKRFGEWCENGAPMEGDK